MPRLLIAVTAVALCGSALPGTLRAQSGAAAAAREDTPVAITGVTVIDVARGRRVPAQTVLVRGSRIAAVGTAARVRVPADARVIDGRGRFLIPGLWDMHAHVADAPDPTHISMPLFVAHGVTGIREMQSDCFGAADSAGGCLARLRRWQREIDAGQLLGPRLVALGSWAVNGPVVLQDSAALPFFGARTEAEGRQLARYFAGRGVDFIKVYSNIPREGFLGLADEARRLGLALAGHEPLTVSASAAAEAGMRSFEHARVFLFNCFPGAAELRGPSAERNPGTLLRRRMIDEHDPQLCADVFRAFRRHGAAYVPTHLTRKMDAYADDSAYRHDPRARFVPRAQWAAWNADADRMVALDSSRGGRRAMMDFYWKGLELTGAAHRAGVRVLLGTDANDSFVFPGSSAHDELRELVAAGLSPAEALRAATLSGPEFLGRTRDFGTVAPGKLADLVLLDADPLADIGNTARIRAVMMNGRYLDRTALDALLAEAERAASSGASR